MRLVHAAALSVAALLLASAASAQGLGAASAQELPATADAAAAAKPEGGEGAAAEGAPTDAEKAAEEARVKAEADWRKRLDQARKEEGVYKDVIDKLQLELNDTTGGFYNPGRASKIAFQDENKQKLAEVQGRISALEEEGRRSGYR